MRKIIDAHIHFDQYSKTNQQAMMESMEKHQIDGLITVSNDLQSAQDNLALAQKYTSVFPSFGFHPEQTLPTDEKLAELFSFIKNNAEQMVAVGEVGLPYYLRQEQKGIKLEAYVELLDQFIMLAKELNKPLVLHAVYDDAPIVNDLLEKYSVHEAHFHWFKGDALTVERMRQNGYYISVTPDVLYEKEIQQLVKVYPLEQIMVETDGPWPFTGPFEGQMTEPKMMHESLQVIATLKNYEMTSVYDKIYQNTKAFYRIEGAG